MLLSVLLHLLYNMYHKRENIILTSLQVCKIRKMKLFCFLLDHTITYDNITMTFDVSSRIFVVNLNGLVRFINTSKLCVNVILLDTQQSVMYIYDSW